MALPRNADVWRRGFTTLFDAAVVPAGWELRMARAAARAVVTDGRVVLFTRRIVGRNLRIHTADHVNLHENTRWILYLHCSGMPPRHILCVYNSRNISHEWTARFDWRLPAAAPGVNYPFCPPENWWKGAIASFRTVRGRPAWIDKLGNGWARPNIPGGAGHHWDVMISSSALREAIGLDQINVIQFGCPAAQGTPGQLHHLPRSKNGRFKSGPGWRCD